MVQTEPAKGSARVRWPFVALLLIFAIIYIGSAFTPGLQDDADASHSEAAREMSLTHDYVTLKINGIRYLEKAALPYWLVSFSMQAFGADAFATRLPNVLAMFGLMLLAVRWGTRAFGQRAGIYGGLFVATTVGYFLFTRVFIPEAILSFFIALSFYCFTTALEDKEAWRWYGGYACMALAVLTKGLVALVLVGIAMLLYLAVSGEWRRWREFRLATGLLVFFVIAAPWHILASVRNPGFFWFYFINEHVMRFLGKRIPHDYNKQESSLYWTLHLVWLFPWSLYLPVALRKPVLEWWARRKQGVAMRAPRVYDFHARTELVCLIWAAVLLVFFSFSTNQEYYTFPVYFPVLLLIASRLAEEEQTSQRWLTWTSGALAIAGIIFAGILVAGLWSSRHLPFVPDIGTVLAKPDLQAATLSMGHMLDLTGESFAALRLPAIIAAITLALVPLAAFILRRRRAHYAATWATGLMMTVFLVAAHIALVRFDPYLGSHNIAQKLQQLANPQDRIIIYGDQSWGSSLVLYLRRPIESVHGNVSSMWWGSRYPDAPHRFLDDKQLVQAWNSSARVFLFVPQSEREKVESELPQRTLIMESSGKQLWSNRPQP
jgi:4-amino-4-deoxy-L-arabinose transferase-like glycosyltransferase